MGELDRRLAKLEDRMLREHVDRQMAQMARICAAEGLPETCLPEIRRGLEDNARWTLAHAPLSPELVEARILCCAREIAAHLGCDPAEVIAEAERLTELYPLEV
jgi:hypothetical protein